MTELLQPVTLNCQELSAMWGKSVGTLRNWRLNGRFGPQPTMVRGRPLYRADELLLWIERGCPNAEAWKALWPKIKEGAAHETRSV